MPGPLGKRVREAVAEVKRGPMPSLAVSQPSAHRASRQILIDSDEVDLRIAEKPVYDILRSGSKAGLDDDAQLNPDGNKARLGDVFYDGVAARADPLIDQWERETAQEEEA